MFVVMLVFAAASQFLLGATRLGRYMYALGSNIEAARRVGVDGDRVRSRPTALRRYSPQSEACCSSPG